MLEIKEVGLDMNKGDPSTQTSVLKLVLLPTNIYMGRPQVLHDMIGSTAETFSYAADKSLPPFSCEELAISCEFGPDR